MRVCTFSHKECWQDETGRWLADGGFPLQISSIASMFDECTLVVGQRESGSGGLPLPNGATVVTLRSPYGQNLRRKISVILRLGEYLPTIFKHARRSDVVHVPVPGDISFLALCVALVTGKRLLARYEGSWLPNSETTLMNRVTRALLRRVAGGKRVVIATGEGSAQPAPRIEWLFSTALTRSELDQIQPVLDRGLADPPRLIYAGRLSPEKGIAFLIRAVAKLREMRFAPLPRVILAGDGNLREELESLVNQLGCQDLICFVGQLNRSGLSTEFERADLCIQPSLTEGYSKAWLDAMAHGLPVISSRVGAAAGVVGERQERGWLVNSGDENALASVIGEVLGGAVDWPALRKRCRRYAEERTLETWTERIGQACAQSWNLKFVDGKLC
jgi:glycosyltransferase involved in cell wall biosynthesis